MKSSRLWVAASTLLLAPFAFGQGALRMTPPVNLVDVLDGAKFKIRVPQNWNGTLLVYLQGTKSGPLPEPLLVPPVLPGSQPDLEATLLERGYALAASDFGTLDMQTKEAAQDSFALTAYFRGRIGEPKRVILWGTSNGGMVGAKMLEDYPRTFDGMIATCAPLGGFPRGMDRHLDFGVAYAAAFGWPEDKWGPLGAPRMPQNLQQDIVANVVMPDASSRGKWEFVRLVHGIPAELFWSTNPIYSMPTWLMNVVFTTWARANQNMYAAGPVAQNLDHRYTLKPEDKAYLAGLGVDADELLAKMNATKVAAAPCSRDYVERFGGLRGLLRRPLLTMHNSADNLAETLHENLYATSVKWWDVDRFLYQTYVNAAGHCVFTSDQLLRTVEAMERWLDTGQRPDPSMFPESQGFNNSLKAPDWPF